METRRIVDTEGLEKRSPWTKHQIYKLCKRPVNPLPHKRLGKRLLFDMRQVWKWFDGLEGRDETEDF